MMGMTREYDDDDAAEDPEVGELNDEAIALLKRYGLRRRAGILVTIDEYGRYVFFIAKGVSSILDSAAQGILDSVDAAVTAHADLAKAVRGRRLQ